MNISGKYEIFKLNKTRWLLGLLLVVSPWILLFFTTLLFTNHSVFSSVPCWSDELSYWHEILSFSQKGFDYGYYSMNEALPRYLSFGTHGFGTVSVYALFAKFFGWKAYSMLIANAFILSLALFILIILLKLTAKQISYILFFSVSFTPLILFSATSMSELLNYSALIIYFGLLHVYFKQGGKGLFLWLITLCTAISFIRIIYILLFLPLLFKRRDEFKFDLKFIVHFVLWIVFSVLLFALNNLFVSPYPDSFLRELFSSTGFSEFVTKFATNFIQNGWNFINPFSENSIQVLQRYLLFFICLICFVKSKTIQTGFKQIEFNYFIVFLILCLFLLTNIGFYDTFDWRDYRVLAPVVFGSVLFLILNDYRSIVNSVLVINLFGLVLLFSSPEVLESFNKGRYIKFTKNKILNQIEYKVNPTTRFENTIVVQQFNKNVVLNIPAGIGISYSEILSDKLKSNYLFSEYKLKLSTYRIIDSNETGYLYQKIALH